MRKFFKERVAVFAVPVVLLLHEFLCRTCATFLTEIWLSILGLIRGFHNVQSFRKDFLEKGPDDLLSQIPHLMSLAEHYSRKARNWTDRRWSPFVKQEPRWLNYIKAHGILNSCIARKRSAEIERKIYELELVWYNGKHPLSKSQSLKMTKHHKRQLSDIRAQFKHCFRQAGKEFRKYFNVDDLLCPENRLIMNRFTSSSRKVSKCCTRAMKQCVHRIFGDSVEIVKQVMGPPPCPFSIVLFGSLAREIEGTPFSDIEFGFIVQSADHQQYFTALAVDIYFRLNNLAETPLKCFFIKELHCITNSGGSTTLRWFDDKAPSGLKFDGITPLAGNIPTGNGLSNKNFILTPYQMFERYRSCYKDENSEKVGDEADMFSTSEVLFEYKKGNGLYAEFQKLRTQFEHHNAHCRQEKKAKTLIDDIKKFEFTPTTAMHTDLRRIQVKQDIFRFPTLLALNLKLVLNLVGNEHKSADQVFNWLLTQCWITEEVRCYLSFSLMSAIWCRNSTYLCKNSQDDSIALLPKCDNSKDKKGEFHIPTSMFVSSMYISHKIKDSICSLLTNVFKGYQNFNDGVLRPALQSLSVDGSDFLLRARLHHTCGDTTTALDILQTTVGDNFDQSPKAMIDICHDRGYTSRQIEDSFLLTADVLYHLGKSTQAKSYFTLAAELPNITLRQWSYYQLGIAMCLVQMSKFSDCYLHCCKASYQLQQKFKKTCFVQVLACLLDPNAKLTDLEKHGLSYMLISSRAFLNSLMDFHQGNYAIHHGESFATIRMSYAITKHFVTEAHDLKHHIIGEFQLCIGMRYDQIGDYLNSGKWFGKAARFYKDFYGVDSAAASVATYIIFQATSSIKLGEYAGGTTLVNQALKILRKLYVKSPSEEYQCHLTLAEAYVLQNQLNLAARHINHCDFIAANHYREGLLQYSMSIACITKARIHLLQKKFQEAKDVCLQAIHRLEGAVSTDHQNYIRDRRTEFDLPQEVVESASKSIPSGRGHLDSHPRICEARGVLADIEVQSGERNFKTAEYLLMRNLKGYEQAYGTNQASRHPATAATYFSLAALEYKRGDNNKSREYSLRSLDILRDTFKLHPKHPRIIENISFINSLH